MQEQTTIVCPCLIPKVVPISLMISWLLGIYPDDVLKSPFNRSHMWDSQNVFLYGQFCKNCFWVKVYYGVIQAGLAFKGFLQVCKQYRSFNCTRSITSVKTETWKQIGNAAQCFKRLSNANLRFCMYKCRHSGVDRRWKSTNPWTTAHLFCGGWFILNLLQDGYIYIYISILLSTS